MQIPSPWGRLPETAPFPMSFYNLFRQFESQAMFTALGAGDVRPPVQGIQPDGVHPLAIIRHCAGASPILCPLP